MATGGSAEIAAECTATSDSEYPTELLRTMWKNQQSAKYTDLTIRVKEHLIHCHKVVVLSACPSLDKFATSKMPEEEIHFDDLNPEVVTKIVEFLYGQDVKFSLDSVGDVLDANKKFGIVRLSDQISHLASEHMTSESVLTCWKVARNHKLEDLRKKAVMLISNNVSAIGASDEFKELSLEDLCIITKDENLKMESRDDLLVACVEWVEYEPMTRKGSMKDILIGVGMEKCSLKTLKTIYTKYGDLFHDVNVLSIVLRGIMNKELFEKGEDIPSARYANALSAIQARGDSQKKNTKLVVLGGYRSILLSSTHRETSLMAENISTCTFKWQEFCKIPDDMRAAHSAIVCIENGFIVLCGGENMMKSMMYDAINKAWHDLPSSPEPVSRASAVEFSNGVYLLGGYGPLDTVYRLDLASLTWSKEANMLDKAQHPISATTSRNIYVVIDDEGSNDVGKNTLQVYDTKETPRSWTYLSSVPHEAPHAASACLAASEDSLYLMGGYHRIAAHYHIPTDTWTLLEQPPTKHEYGKALLYAGKVVMIGDLDGNSYVTVYDIQRREWSFYDSNLPLRLHHFEAAMVAWS